MKHGYLLYATNLGILNILQKKIVIAVGPTGQSSAVFHPNGHIYQHGSRVEILTYDYRGNNK
jgi:hypothetical protein